MTKACIKKLSVEPNLEPMATNTRLMTVAEIQTQLRLSVTSIYRLISAGLLDKIKIGAATRITRASVDRLIADAVKSAGNSTTNAESGSQNQKLEVK